MEGSWAVSLGPWNGGIGRRGVCAEMRVDVWLRIVQRRSSGAEDLVLCVGLFQFTFEALVLVCDGRLVCFESIKLHL